MHYIESGQSRATGFDRLRSDGMGRVNDPLLPVAVQRRRDCGAASAVACANRRVADARHIVDV